MTSASTRPKSIATSIVCLCTILLGGCASDPLNPPPPAPPGSITVEVTIEETNQPPECAAVG